MIPGFKYRPDIDGLRAIAVVAVILFHAKVPGFSGGYVGVDVFFVISGYLITSLILVQQDKGKFTLLWFYERRIRRIFPALFVVMLATAAIGALVMTPDDYKNLGRSIFATSIFCSNLLFWRRSGYFNSPAELQPLLHTWSLAVEEQFYLAFPLLMMFLNKSKNVFRIMVFLAAFSFLSASVVVSYSPISAFYLFPFRAWELFLGAILAMGPVLFRDQKNLRSYCSALGLAMIFGTIFFFSKNTLFPGATALLPTVGAALFIWAGEDTLPVANRLSAVRPAVFVGKISYSLYLWHFVLLSFGSYLSVGSISPARVVILLLCSFVLAVLSYYTIEQPIRRAIVPLLKGRALLGITGLSIAGLALIGWTIRASEGVEARMTADQLDQLNQLKRTRASAEAKCTPMSLSRAASHQFCDFGTIGPSGPSFFVWGNSHARLLESFLETTAESRAVAGHMAKSYGCPPLVGMEGGEATKDCFNINRYILQFVVSQNSIKNVILVARWAYHYYNENKVFPGAIDQTVGALVAAKKNVWIVGPVPEVLVGSSPGVEIDVPKALYLKSMGIGLGDRIEPTRDEFDGREHPIISILKAIEQKYHVHVVWPDTVLCDQKICMTEQHGRPLYAELKSLIFFGNSTYSAGSWTYQSQAGLGRITEAQITQVSIYPGHVFF